jgi:hypothetical protein
MYMSALLKLYPPAWRARYGTEMTALLETRPPTARDRLDLVRGAADAWLHPVAPSLVPAGAALLGGGLWTIVSVGVLAQPVPADWPGYVLETVPLAALAAASILVAASGCLLRVGEGRTRPKSLAAGLLVAGSLAWIAMLVGTALGWVSGPMLGAAQTVAMLGIALVGLTLVRDRGDAVGLALLVAPTALLLPSVLTWPLFGAIWTAIGIALWLERQPFVAPTAGGGRLGPG